MYLLFDIGGSKMRFAVSQNGKKFKNPIIIKTPREFNDGIKIIKKIILEISAGKRIKAAAGGIAGPLDNKKTKLVGSPNLPEWVNKPLQKELKKIIKAPVLVENDADIVGLGEAIAGAGRGKRIVAYLTISTGVGGVRIVNGKIDESANGFEPGHQIIDFNSNFRLNKYGAMGDLESYVSGTAFKKRYKKDPADSKKNKKAWQEINRRLAIGLHNTIVFWSPDIIVLGGGMTKGDDIKISQLKKYLSKTLKIFPRLPLIKKATLKNVGGLYGALELIKNYYEKY
jgi:glucokinase